MEGEKRAKIIITVGALGLAAVIFLGMLVADGRKEKSEPEKQAINTESSKKPEEQRYPLDMDDIYDMRLDAEKPEDYYMRSCWDLCNLYTIDEDGVLWGSGENDYGQIGLGYADEEFYEEKNKIAENVVHVDASQHGFVIYITEEGKLYGLGNDSTYMLLQHTDEPVDSLIYPTRKVVTSPVLLMEDVSYARCGRDDIVTLKKDGTIWTWGMIWNYGETGYCKSKPEQILSDVKIVTGGFFNHAALKEDGTVWTWGYNYSGNCGTNQGTMVEVPIQVADHVKNVWTGSLNYSAPSDDIRDLEGLHLEYMDNTVIETYDGDFLACGREVGDKKVALTTYYEASEFETVCSYEFLLLDWTEKMLREKMEQK